MDQKHSDKGYIRSVHYTKTYKIFYLKGELKMEDNKLRDFLIGIGSMCEFAGLMRDNLIKNGFTREEACKMTTDFLVNALENGKKNE